MKVEVKEIEVKNEIEYPCLMRSEDTGNIVLFVRARVGTVVSIGRKNETWKIGEHSKCFSSVNFLPFNGTITLQND